MLIKFGTAKSINMYLTYKNPNFVPKICIYLLLRTKLDAKYTFNLYILYKQLFQTCIEMINIII